MDLKDLLKLLKSSPYLKKNWLTLLLASLGLLLIILSLLIKTAFSNKTKGFEIISGSEASESAKIYIDVSGAVSKPGLYELKADSRVNDVLIMAGGLAVSADRDWFAKNINLAKKLVDGAKIYIPFRKEFDPGSKTANDPGSPIPDKINLNTASLSQLDTLSGVGPVTAQKIIDYRSQNGSFSQIEDLLKITGIGQKLFDQVKDKLTVY